jgi:hypothetical protein
LRDVVFCAREDKRFEDAQAILAAMRRAGSIEYAVALADRLAHDGVRRFEEDLSFLAERGPRRCCVRSPTMSRHARCRPDAAAVAAT